MKPRPPFHTAALSLVALALFLPCHVLAAPVVQQIGGDSTAASIAPTRDAFRLDIGGGTTAGANGSFGGLRREINWDGVPATSSAPNNLAANFFNSTSPRGAVFSTPGTGFQVSGAPADVGAGQPAEANFGNINPTYSSTFGVFTASRLFTAMGSNVTDVTFFMPGTSTAATVAAFGAVFTDVDTIGSTTIQYFDQANASLGIFTVPTGSGANQSLSFLGVSFNAGERIGSVRITSGNTALGAGVNEGLPPSPALVGEDGGITAQGAPPFNDLVVMDDFIYSEPTPEPSSLFLCALGVTGLLSARKRNRRGSR